MSRIQKEKTRTIEKAIRQILRFAAITVLGVLVLSLFISTDGGSSLAVLAFNSPNQSPPSHDPNGPPDTPPGQSNSPPGHFHSPPGPFNSPPGHFQSPLPPGQQDHGNGAGLGPSRRINLSYVPNSWVYSPQAKGTIWVNAAFRDDHPKWPGFPQGIDYQIDHLECRDFGFDRRPGTELEGRWFYTLYMTTADGQRVRLQSFNPGCRQFNYNSAVYLPDIPEEALFDGDLRFEVHLELDDYFDTPVAFPNADALIMVGEDFAN